MSEEKRVRDFRIVAKDLAASDARTLLLIGSTETPDRDDDIVLSDGWDLKNYMKNPVVLWAHDYSIPPVGKTLSVYVDQRSKQLCFKVYFPSVDELSTPGQPPSEHALFVDTVYNMYKCGLLNATSVGFIGKVANARDDQNEKPLYSRGMKFSGQELLELSCVPVPANADAIVQARGMKGLTSKGIDLVASYLEKQLIDKSVETEGEEDMAEKLTEEEVVKLKGFIASLPPDKVESKAGKKLSASTLSSINKAMEHATNAIAELKSLASDGVEEGTDNGSSDGTEEQKSLDLSTLTVEQANTILRLGGDRKGA